MIGKPLFNRMVIFAMVVMAVVTTSYSQEIIPADTLHIKPIEFDLLSPVSPAPGLIGYDMPDLLSEPGVNVPPVMPKFKPEFYPDFYVSKSPLHKGDYNVSGMIRQLDNGVIYGMGSQNTLPGMGTMNFANVGYQHFFNDRFSMNVGFDARQSNIPNFRAHSFGTSGAFSYQLNDRLTVNAFGAYSAMPGTKFHTYDYGGTLNVGISERFGTEMGARRHYNSATRQWETIPIVIPYYKFNEKFTLGMDVGGILMQILQNVKVNNRLPNPTIGPPIP